MLTVSEVDSGYGRGQVLFDVSLSIGEGEVVSLMGKNGMGKTTLIRTIMGMLPLRKGDIQFNARSTRGMAMHRIAAMGLGWVPEGRLIFPSLSVEENLVATACKRKGLCHSWTLEQVYALFPRLQERRDNGGGQLSGGEQQMLAIGRALMTNPKLLILDEATEGLAPKIRQEIWQTLSRVKETGQSILVVDKDVKALSKLADRHYMIEKGRIAWKGNTEMLMADTQRVQQYVGV
ncbi:ABC transporter ATP-binding protein [Neopusillimonas maritima]|uniref:ABC transporter ATP-binding protein n=1 Tax=Neopusillimonas maritima TaxID=2026239 RepID=A0ABX9N007_9BURK|nr:ABC transporter ATP-binding protein [Neopusillimonas maritima]